MTQAAKRLDGSPARAGRIDAVGVAIFNSRCRNIAWIVGSTLLQSARSTLMQQGDLAAGLLDRDGRVIALDEHLPLMAYSLAPAVRGILAFFGDDIHEGDVFLQNDVWHGNIQHADVGAFVPVFADGALIAWVGSRGHWSDIGGALAGTANPDALEVWQEALRIPPLRVHSKGRPLADVWNLVFANVRMRDRVESDARAQIGACRLGGEEAVALVRRLGGPASFETLVESLFAASERALEGVMADLPRGRFEGSSIYVDDAPSGLAAFLINACVEIGPSSIVVDFSGTAAATGGMMNAPLLSTQAATLVTILTALGPRVDHNEGVLSRFEIRAPEGCMLNAPFPAATFGGNKLCEYIGLAINDALAKAIPDRVGADWSRRLSMRVGGKDPRNGRSFHEIFFLTYGGGGAVDGADGYNQPGLMSGGNVIHQDYEQMELLSPMIVWRHEYMPDSAGNGRWRGGLGNETVVEHYGTDLVFVTHGGGTTEGAEGRAGGEAGILNLLEITDRDGCVRRLHARAKVGPLQPPVISRQVTGGGGGYGPPADRPAALQAQDRRRGLTSTSGMRS